MTHKIKSMQALRGIACLAVVAFHNRSALAEQFPSLAQWLVKGVVGVDLFFILSGFVITLSVSRMGSGFAAAADFLRRRALRLLPAYYILLLVNFLLGGAMATFHYPDKVKALIAALTLSVYMPQHAPFYMDDEGFLNVRWTLNYEFLFYLIMAACLVVKQRWVALAVALSALLIGVPLAADSELTLGVSGHDMGFSYLNLMTNPIIWQFAVGVVIGLVYPYIIRLPVAARVPFLLAAAVLVVKHLSSDQNVGHGLMASGTVLALLLAAVAFNDSWLRHITPRWLVFLGDISFSVYLIHIVIMRQMYKLFPAGGTSLFVASLAATLVVGWLSFRYIEPIGQNIWRRRADAGRAEIKVNS
ncbi:acyltransferase [Pantoea sp. Mb-10]|uniref:acyltransferase family protein n=1 Tax=unclassified Pantoea TaxID=2630326 RepID=UPI001E63D84D|nr:MULTISPECIES: acyltransferase [unclassified Pantoea]MCE0491416.1 acyltransferase [Pantoea sp. Mb-10]MCE0502230.1 acyltransferase [Pantoea sp. Pb-8]